MCITDLILIGDSLTFGYGVSKSNSWVEKLKTSYPELNIINKGVNGDTSTGILSRFSDDILKYNVKNVFIMCGTNDLLSGRSVDSIIQNIELMIKDCISINSKVFIGIPPYLLKDLAEKLFMPSNYYNHTESSLPILRENLYKLKEKYPITLLDFYTLIKSNLDNKIFLDGIHLNPAGHTLLFNEACKILF